MEDTATLSALRVNQKSLSLKQLLHRLRVDASLAAIDRCKEDLAIECWAESLGLLGLAAENGELQAAVTRFRRENGLFTAAGTNDWLSSRGMTLDELVAILRPQALRSMLAAHTVSDDEIRRHFLEFAQQYDGAEISIIVTAEYGAAQELRFRVEEGSDFHTLARQFSSDAATAKAGGYIGLMDRSGMEPETAAAVFGAAAGAIIGPFERRGEYHLIYIEELYLAELSETVEAAIREQLFQYKLEAYQRTLDIHEDLWSFGKEWSK